MWLHYLSTVASSFLPSFPFFLTPFLQQILNLLLAAYNFPGITPRELIWSDHNVCFLTCHNSQQLHLSTNGHSIHGCKGTWPCLWPETASLRIVVGVTLNGMYYLLRLVCVKSELFIILIHGFSDTCNTFTRYWFLCSFLNIQHWLICYECFLLKSRSHKNKCDQSMFEYKVQVFLFVQLWFWN